MTCKCGTELITEKRWMGPDGYEILGYDFAFVTFCPKRNIFNFWKHNAAEAGPVWMIGSRGYELFHG